MGTCRQELVEVRGVQKGEGVRFPVGEQGGQMETIQPPPPTQPPPTPLYCPYNPLINFKLIFLPWVRSVHKYCVSTFCVIYKVSYLNIKY